jgi:hypothetical protein
MRRAQSILHGSEEAKKEGETEVLQHSRIIGRGKYVHGFEGTRSSFFRGAALRSRV